MTDATKPLPFQVIGVGVVLNAAGEVLIDQRLEEGLLGGMWEFPGGKQEPGETIETCIARELKEELDIAVTVGDELITVDHAYSHKKLRFVVHLCSWTSGEPQPLASQHALDVAIENRLGSISGAGEDSTGCGATDPREGDPTLKVRWPARCCDGPRCLLKAPCPGVVPKALPKQPDLVQ